jgi:hypothetical protein
MIILVFIRRHRLPSSRESSGSPSSGTDGVFADFCRIKGLAVGLEFPAVHQLIRGFHNRGLWRNLFQV